MQLSSRILTALAVLILAVTVVAVRAGSTGGVVEAATGTIDVLNVGTCYTTNTDVFYVDECKDGHEDDIADARYDVAGRATITEVGANTSVYATYAIDPKTSGDAPRGILMNSDVIKISINDKGRDKRSGVLYAVGSNTLDNDERGEIASVLDDLADELKDDAGVIQLTNDRDTESDNEARFELRRGAGSALIEYVSRSGNHHIGLAGVGSTKYPMAPRGDGKIVWFGCVEREQAGGTPPDGDCNDPGEEFVDLKSDIELDEDVGTGARGDSGPWMTVSVSVPENGRVNIQYIYYQTSMREIIVGGKKKANYVGYDHPDDADRDVEKDDRLDGFAPSFTDAEGMDNVPDDQDALVLNGRADGDIPMQNLWLKETGDFTGVYEGYLRLTDAGGSHCDHDNDSETPMQRCNWGLETTDATSDEMDDAAIIGVESGPVIISYKNSNGDVRNATILIDKAPPAIQIDSPAHNTSSKDDSPDLLGTFNDGGGSGLRDNSFRIYVDNQDDSNDETPVWDFRVDEMDKSAYGYVFVDENDGIAALRGHYAGYSSVNTFGIISADKVYLSTDNPVDGAADLYKTANAEDYEDGDDSGIFDSVVRIDFPPPEGEDNRYNNTIDIQAVVLDIAGNFGFSDSQPSDPTFIHDYGTVRKDRDKSLVHNVLGWYSRHQYRLDDVDPYFKEEQSATGFFIDENGDETTSNSGLKVVFDNDVDEASIGLGTFVVRLDDGRTATITDVDVDGKNVYLMLEEVLEPDATPRVDLATGASILDLAGNEATDRRLDDVELNDGILPTFTIMLSGGSGLNEDIDGEGSSELTRNQMTISIESNENIQGAPQFSVVCSSLTWGKLADENNVAKFAENRMGAMTSSTFGEQAPNADEHGRPEKNPDSDDPKTTPDIRTTCEPEKADDSLTSRKFFQVATTSALARPGNRWEYLWANLSGDQMLQDGELSVIVWGRDRSSYENDSGEKLLNYSSEVVTFNYDTDLKAAWDDADNSELIPDNGNDVFEPRPFVLLDFGDEKTTVNVTKFEVDKIDHTADLQILDNNEFVWWPEPLAYGKYSIYVEANDAANNTDDHTYSFTVKERTPFTISLLAGWSSISFPANPIDRALHAVFTNPEIDQVVGWNQTEPVSPWRMATRVDGVWTTNEEYATLNDVEARYGYWVHSKAFVRQSVKLAGKGDRATDGQPSPTDIPTDEGWNFVGVVDVDGDQTQDNADETLRNSDEDPVTAAEYLGNYTRAYTWDHVNNTWDVVKKDEGVTIGTGLWVYYTKDYDIAP